MPIIRKRDVKSEQRYPGILRWELASRRTGATSLLMGELLLQPGARVPTHTHPNEEAMLVTEGHLESILGDQHTPVGAGDLVLAPPGVAHGLVNRSGKEARLYFFHPVPDLVMRMQDEKG